jgi:hypothetical protein
MAARACGLFFQHVDPSAAAACATMSVVFALDNCARLEKPCSSSRLTTVGPTPLTASRAYRSSGENAMAVYL